MLLQTKEPATGGSSLLLWGHGLYGHWLGSRYRAALGQGACQCWAYLSAGLAVARGFKKHHWGPQSVKQTEEPWCPGTRKDTVKGIHHLILPFKCPVNVLAAYFIDPLLNIYNSRWLMTQTGKTEGTHVCANPTVQEQEIIQL